MNSFKKILNLILIIFLASINFQYIFWQSVNVENKGWIENKVTNEMKYAAWEIIVKFKLNKINLKTSWWKISAQNFAENKNMETSENISNNNIAVMKIEWTENVENKINELKSDPNVEYVQPNYIYKIEIADPNDTNFDKQRWLKNIWQNANGTIWTSWADIWRNEAMDIWSWNWNINTTWTIVAVIDNGVNYNHNDLINNIRSWINCVSYTWWILWWCIGGYDFYQTGDNNPFPNWSDYHGSHVAWIIGASMNNGIGVVGVNPNAKIMAIRAWSWNYLYTDDIIQWIDFAKYNWAKIINASRWWWAEWCVDNRWSRDQLLYEAIKNFPWLVIAAAGNDWYEHLDWYFSTPVDFSATTSCRTWLDNILWVAATDQNDELISWSDYWSWSIGVWAPWVNIYSTVSSNNYGYLNWTSMSTPFVAWLASLARSMRSDLNYSEIKSAIVWNGDSLPSLSWKITSSKRINAFNTLLALDNIAPTATIIYSTTWWTSWNVIASITWFSEIITWLNTWNYIFTWNESFTFTFQDLAWNTWSTTATVSWIDNVNPIIWIWNSWLQFTWNYVTITWTAIDELWLSWIYVNGILATWTTDWSVNLTWLVGWINNFIITWIDLAWNIWSWTWSVIRINYLSDLSGIVLSSTWAIITFTTDLLSSWYVIYGTWNLDNIKTWDNVTWHNITLNLLVDNTTYYYRAYAMNDWYTWNYSSTWYFTTPLSVNNLTWTRIITWQIKLEWSTSTWINFSSTWILILNSTGNWNNFIQINLSWFIITTSWWTWDWILTPPIVTTNPTRTWWLPASWTNNWTTTTTRTILLNMQVWTTTDSLIASGGYFNVSFVVSGWVSWDIIKLYRSENWLTWTWNYPDSTWILNSGLVCNFRTDHLSYFISIKETTNSNWWNNNNPWGGGGWTTTTWNTNTWNINTWTIIDDCPDWDFSPNDHDGTCKEKIKLLVQTGEIKWSIIWSPYSKELNDAYLYAYEIWITDMPTIQKANMEWNLLREHMAKMMVNYSVKVLKKTINTWLVCNFNDTKNETAEMQMYIKLSCQLWLMWWESDGKTIKKSFNPKDIISRSQFGTVLSRAMFGTNNDGWNPYYVKHLNALKNLWIIKDIANPQKFKERRWYVMLMMMRAKAK